MSTDLLTRRNIKEKELPLRLLFLEESTPLLCSIVLGEEDQHHEKLCSTSVLRYEEIDRCEHRIPRSLPILRLEGEFQGPLLSPTCELCLSLQ